MRKKKENPVRKIEPYRILNDLLDLNKDIACDKISLKKVKQKLAIYIHKK